MDGARFIETIRLENILSFGPTSEPFPLEPLNVLIGPNASGKSNLIEALSLLQAAPWDLQEPIRTGGGVDEWMWKGSSKAFSGTLEVTVRRLSGQNRLKYRLEIAGLGGRFFLFDEAIEDEGSESFYYRFDRGQPVLNLHGSIQRLNREGLDPDQSILSQRRDPDSYPELTYLGNRFRTIRFYRGWETGRQSPMRLPQSPDLPQDFLQEDGSNLGLVLSDLLNRPPEKAQVLERMQDFYPRVNDVHLAVTSGTVQIFFHEQGLLEPIPATRLSDGSLRYLCLLAVLCHPSPPPVVCIEEPELGLHPDIIPEVAKLLVEASSRTQLFVTTHSDVLVDALTETPEAVVVCEKVDGATQLRRLDPEELAPWLAKYRLGELWTSGEIGGNRW